MFKALSYDLFLEKVEAAQHEQDNLFLTHKSMSRLKPFKSITKLSNSTLKIL